MHEFKFHTDPGHGWLEVPRHLLDDLNIGQKITSFSYEKDDKVYLEEDRDILTFMNVFVPRFGRPNYIEVYAENSPVRKYSRYKFKTLQHV